MYKTITTEDDELKGKMTEELKRINSLDEMKEYMVRYDKKFRGHPICCMVRCICMQ